MSPRRNLVFESKIKELNQKYDIYRERYNFNELSAYETARAFFLSRKEYTHAAILPDDLLIDLKEIDQLVEDLKTKDYPVLSGICNFSADTEKFFNTMAVIPLERYIAWQNFKEEAKYKFDDLLQRAEWKKKYKQRGVQQVLFAAFPFTIIKRDVLEKIGFQPIPQTSTRVINGMGLDTVFYNNCMRSKIECYVDYNVQAFHFKQVEVCKDNDKLMRWADKHNVNSDLERTRGKNRESILLKATNK